MKPPQLAAFTLLLTLTVGCGSSADKNAATSGATPASPVRSADAGASPANNDRDGDGLSANPIRTPGAETPVALPAAPDAPPVPKDPPPTAEQIARWTPPPFKPLQLLAVLEPKQTSFTSRLAAAPDGSHFIVAGSRVLLWPLTGDEPEHVFLDLASEDGDRELEALAVSPDGKWFAVGDSEGTLRIWSLDDRRELISKQIYDNDIQYIAISPDAGEIATISYDGNVSTWSADKLEQKNKFDVTASGIERIEYVAPNLIAAAGESTTIWNTSTGAKVHDLPAGRYNFALARTPDGAKFIFGAEDALNIWDVAAAKPDATVLRGVAGNVLLDVSPDGKTLATTDGRGVDLWSLADGRRLQSIEGYGWTIVGVRWLPKTNLLAVASEIGVTRIWGTPAQGEPLGLKALHAPVALPDPAEKAPATPEQLEQMTPWDSLPTLPGSVTSLYSPTDLSSTAPVTIAEARAFYRHFLTRAGWTESPPNPNNPTSMEFSKDGFQISAYGYDDGEGKTNISLHYNGAYDVRWAPKFDAAPIETVHFDEGSGSYRAKAGILEIETWLLRKFHDAGWAAYARLNSSYNEEPDKRDFEFIKNGASLRVSIGKFPDDTAETYTVQYSLFPNETWAPIPPDAGFVEFDGSTEPELIAITKLSLAEAREFYDREFISHGWLTRQIGRSIKDEQIYLPYLRGQKNLTVSLTKLPDNRTLVIVGDAYTGSLWEASQPKEEGEEEEVPANGLQAADFPLLNATKTGKFDVLHKQIEVPIEGSTLASAAELYTKALGDIGWKAAEGGIRDEEYTFFDFTKDELEISFRARNQDGVAVVSVEGDGLLWTKDLPGGKQVISYETWLRLSKLPPSLEFLERYETEMKAIAAK